VEVPPPAPEAAAQVRAADTTFEADRVDVPYVQAAIEQTQSSPIGPAVMNPPIEQLPDAAIEQIQDGPVTAAQARLGSEGLGRLRARHAEVLARISEKIADPVRRDELKSQADRLNPDTWVTDAEVTAGLEAYETVFEAVRGVVGRRRKRRRARGDSTDGAQPPQDSTASQPPADGADDGDGDL
jgi:hypothetical protein